VTRARIFIVLLGLCGVGALASVAVVGLSCRSNAEVAPKTHGIHPALRRHLMRLSQALQARHAAKVLVVGSSSTVGVGASSPSKTYVARLEPDLERAVTGADFEVVGRGISGEVAQGAADRMRREVEDVKPDLVIWQVGTNDALSHVAIDRFRTCLKTTLAWLKERNIDVVLINPQYAQVLVKDDAYYEQVVKTIANVAQESQVLLVDRYGAMRKLDLGSSRPVDLSPDNLHMNDEGYRRLAEQLTETIVDDLPPGGGTSVANRQTPRAAPPVAAAGISRQ
jgi:acyl-CoA thioesterase I